MGYIRKTASALVCSVLVGLAGSMTGGTASAATESYAVSGWPGEAYSAAYAESYAESSSYAEASAHAASYAESYAESYAASESSAE